LTRATTFSLPAGAFLTAVSTSVVNFFWASAAVASADFVISDVVAVVMSYR
jgi:hypothetical protein